MCAGTAMSRQQTPPGRRSTAILTHRFHNQVHGSFYWRIAADGYRPKKADKQLYGQAFALFALAEQALATGSAADAATAVEGLSSDRSGGGDRRRDWSAPRARPRATIWAIPWACGRTIRACTCSRR